ncbi:uncharacterized protein LOC110058869 [Orbicella faveolata]|uniref:uncharacterized protein LOC110058869 n=1 Tax=Orbicella faveolata TaxID=48498 RepID=UPI0009E3CB6C|nr:uncharacterized protein LOC110058869 [Orbicella faveolata]
MKILNLCLLIILLMADACWSGHVNCRMANWWTSFDYKGWSQCDSKEYVTGFMRNHRTRSDPIGLLEEGRCCKALAPYQDTSSTCEYTDWWAALDGNYDWAYCRNGYFVQDLYRSSGHGVSNIEAAYCCKPSTLNGYGNCYTEDVWSSFDKRGIEGCRDGYYLVGIYKGGCNRLHCIEKFKCCEMGV